MSEKVRREYPCDMPDDTIRYLQNEERKQTQHIKVAKSRANVRETVVKMHNVMEKVGDRGKHINVVEEQVDDLLDTSEDFYYAAMPGWKRYALSWVPPLWWVPMWLQRCCKRRRRIKKKSLLP